MKRLFSLLICLAMLLPSLALSESSYDQIMSSEHLSFGDARALLKDAQESDLQALAQLVETIAVCEGLYVQEKSSSGKVYTAEVELFLNKGVPYAQVVYTGFRGTLASAPIVEETEGNFQFVTRPDGTFLSNILPFTIRFGGDTLNIVWGSSDYTLKRSYGDVEEASSDAPTPFIQTDAYRSILTMLDKALGNRPYHARFDEATKTLSVYGVINEGARSTMISHMDELSTQWSPLLDGIKDITSRISTAMTLTLRSGMYDFTKAHCRFTFVDRLTNNDVYDQKDILAIVEDGVVTYDFFKEEKNRPATMGEKNALKKAKSYLQSMSFSRSGLIDQLKFEGFSQSEAEYAVSRCGADWNEQAAKKAKSYLSFMSFSRSKLIDQLEFDGFTNAQAVYGVEQNGY